MTTMHTLEQRLRALESRLADIEGGYGRTIYDLRRDVVGVKLDLRKMLGQMGLTPTTAEEIDAALDDA